MHQCPSCKEDCRCDGTDIRLTDFDECTHCVLDEEDDEDEEEDSDDDDSDLEEDDDDDEDEDDGDLVHGGESGHE